MWCVFRPPLHAIDFDDFWDANKEDEVPNLIELSRLVSQLFTLVSGYPRF